MTKKNRQETAQRVVSLTNRKPSMFGAYINYPFLHDICYESKQTDILPDVLSRDEVKTVAMLLTL